MSLVLWFFEFGYLLQHLGTLFQILRIKEKKKAELVSLETNLFFLIGITCRLIWMWDSMLKDFFLAYLELILGFGSLLYLLYLYRIYSASIFASQNQVQLPVFLKFQTLLPVIMILSFLFHPGVKGKYYFTVQMFVSMNMFSEAIGLLPQLYMIIRERESGNISQYYVVFLGIARFFRLLFWIKMYIDGSPFISLIIADLLHSLLLFVFIYVLFKNWKQTLLPTFGETTQPKKLF